MTDMQRLIETCDSLCNTLAQAANNDRQFCADLQIKLETMSWEMWRSTNDLKEMLGTYGGYNG